MTVFADYDFYKNEYLCGKEAVIDTASFKFYAIKATRKIIQYTFENVDKTNPPKCVRHCCCEIAELLFNAESNSRNGVSSSSTGDVSVSYESSESQRQALSQKIRCAIYLWLADTDLLYRGVE